MQTRWVVFCVIYTNFLYAIFKASLTTWCPSPCHIKLYLDALINMAFGFLLVPSGAECQRGCASIQILERQLKENPTIKKARQRIEQHRQKQKNVQGPFQTHEDIVIPVVFNIVWHTVEENVSNEQILSQLDVLNADYRRLNLDIGKVPDPFAPLAADFGITFCLARFDPNGLPTTGIRRRRTNVAAFHPDDEFMKFDSTDGLDIWDRDRYLNIWVCDIEYPVIGQGQFPGGGAATDGVVIDFEAFGTMGTAREPYNLGRTATHEVGHWLDLYHIWGEGNSCSDSDLVDDTPNQAGFNLGCPTFPRISCGNGPNGDMFMNYMDYSNDSCMFMFTNGQRSRMLPLFAPGGFREPILTSPACYCGVNSTTHIYQNTLFKTDTDMPGDIIIHSGAELLVEARIGMRQGARVVVERNARLVVDNGGVLTRGCNSPHWGGIQVLGNGNMAQPAHNAPLNNPNQAGIVWIDNATVEWARTGISAGGGYGPDYWGGMVWTNNNALFRNNRKAVEFMRYRHTTNQSRFFHTTFEEQAKGAFADTEGVTIWDTDDIEFHDCTFQGFDQEGIRAYDAAVRVVNSCEFYHNDMGVSAYATYPMSRYLKIGDTEYGGNIFEKNAYHVNASLGLGFLSTEPTGRFNLSVIANQFYNGEFGVVVDGPSNYVVGGNHFYNTLIGAWASNTAFNSLSTESLVACNFFLGGQAYGALAIGENGNLLIPGNTFYESLGSDILLTGSEQPSLAGSIDPMQGSSETPSGNCFSGNGTPDLLTSGQTNPFTYWYDQNGPDVGCNSEPVSGGNYTVEGTSVAWDPVACYAYGGGGQSATAPATFEALTAARSALENFEANFSAGAPDSLQYRRLLRQKDGLLMALVQAAVESGQYAAAEALLSAENTKAANWGIFGLRVAQGDYPGALAWLNVLPVENETDAQFRDVQRINLQRLQAGGLFELSTTQEATLNAVAESGSPVRGFARAILGLLKDRRFYPEGMEGVADRGAQRISTGAKVSALALTPVPATDQVFAAWPALGPDAQARLWVYDLLGKKMADIPVGPSQTQQDLDVSQWPNGLYLVALSNKGKVVHQSKFSVQH